MPSYISPKVKSKTSLISGKGLFALEEIKIGEIIVDYSNGKGEYIDSIKADNLYDKGRDYMIQVDDNLFFAAVSEDDYEEGDSVNHSCNPNCGIKNKLQIVAMRDIKYGEEITIDYAMMESTDYDFVCSCKSYNCRGKVTGNDWKIKYLQEKYKGYFSDYLQKKILPQIYRP